MEAEAAGDAPRRPPGLVPGTLGGATARPPPRRPVGPTPVRKGPRGAFQEPPLQRVRRGLQGATVGGDRLGIATHALQEARSRRVVGVVLVQTIANAVDEG